MGRTWGGWRRGGLSRCEKGCLPSTWHAHSVGSGPGLGCGGRVERGKMESGGDKLAGCAVGLPTLPLLCSRPPEHLQIPLSSLPRNLSPK